MQDNIKKESMCPYAGVPYSRQPQDDEINLLDIWNVLWGQRIFILIITFIAAMAAIVFLFLAKDTYVVKVEIAPVNDIETQILQQFEAVLNDLKLPSDNDVFLSVYSNLTSTDVQSQFWDEIVDGKRLTGKMVSIPQNKPAKEHFIQNLNFKVPKGKNIYNQGITVSLSGSDPEITTELLNKFVLYANELAVRNVLDSIKIQLQNRKEIIANDIEIQKNLIMQRQLKAINNYNQAIMIAEKLGIYDPKSIVDAPLYARGVKALQMERDLLQSKEKKDEFDEQVFVLESNLANIEKIQFDKVNITPSQLLTAPATKQNQRSLVILFFAIIAGLVFAVFLAFLKNFLQQIKK
jgi:chain length determinant protein (polysaccharide antigen chain regulator)